MHWFDIQQYGQNALLVPEGYYIEVAVRSKSGGRDFCYCYSGYERHYSTVENQEFDFTTHHSDWNENSTDTDWGFFPFILYQPKA